MEKASEEGTSTTCTKLTPSQLARMERNRQKALLLRQARLAKKPIPLEQMVDKHERRGAKHPRDSGGGFLLEDSESDEDKSVQKRMAISEEPAASHPVQKLFCEECQQTFTESYLFSNFDLAVCNNCRDRDEKHAFITKTDAKNEFLLKDCDLDSRTPPLKFLLKKNPHAKRGEMKLYLRCQVEKRALEVWGSEEKLEEAHKQRNENRTSRKMKAYDKKMKALRMAVRSSLYKKDVGAHEHDYGPERYVEENDAYEKTCKSCGHVQQYEKM